MASRGKSILHVLHRTRFSPETIQQIIAKPLPPPRLAFPHLYYEPFTRYATERQGSYANGWERQRFPFVPERLPRLPEIHDPVIRERVFTHLSARTELPKRGLKHKRVMDRWLESYKRYEGLGDVVINHAASLAAEKSRTKAVSLGLRGHAARRRHPGVCV
jgi:dsRNA-specific ribonuclease